MGRFLLSVAVLLLSLGVWCQTAADTTKFIDTVFNGSDEGVLLAASENLGEALSAASSVFGTQMGAVAKKLNEGLLEIGRRDSISLLNSNIDEFKAELRNAMDGANQVRHREFVFLFVSLSQFHGLIIYLFLSF